MENHFIFILLIVNVLHQCSGVIYHLNDTEYDRMPAIFHLDPYEPCFHRPGGLYCTVDAVLVSDSQSPLLDMIHEYSAHVITHFNHSKLFYGLCVTERCKSIYKNTTSDLRTTLEACLNETIQENYSLGTKVLDTFYCNREINKMNIDTGDLVVAGVLLLLVLLNIVGSIYDFHFTSGKSGEGIKFLLCFSIRRNWRRLVAPVPDALDSRLKRLKGLNGIRCFTIVGVIMVHSMMPAALAIDNTKKIEEMYQNLLYHILYNGTLVVQTFFIISGFLMVFNYMIFMEKHQPTWKIMPKWIFMRWLRLTPPYAVVLAITATWARFAGSGPLWQKVVGVEVADCRRDWWLHLIYLGNYVDQSECMAQTWYLAADMQLYIVGITLCVILRSNTSRKVVLPIFLVIGLLTSGLQTYFQDLNGVMVVSPETMRSVFVWDMTFNNVYKRGHTNLAGYVLGLALGCLIHYWHHNQLDLRKYYKYRYFFWSLLPLAFGIMFLGIIFYADAPPMSIYFRSAYAALVKPAFGMLVAILITAMYFKYEHVARGILEWNSWLPVSRVSYSAFLLHILFVRTFLGCQKTLLHVQEVNMVEIFLGTLVVTFSTAYIFYLTVESPVAEVIKLLMGSKKKEVSNSVSEQTNAKTEIKIENNGVKTVL